MEKGKMQDVNKTFSTRGGAKSGARDGHLKSRASNNDDGVNVLR